MSFIMVDQWVGLVGWLFEAERVAVELWVLVSQRQQWWQWYNDNDTITNEYLWINYLKLIENDSYGLVQIKSYTWPALGDIRTTMILLITIRLNNKHPRHFYDEYVGVSIGIGICYTNKWSSEIDSFTDCVNSTIQSKHSDSTKCAKMLKFILWISSGQ